MLRIAEPQTPAPGRAPQGGSDTPRLIERGGLLAALDRAAARRVTVISAPAGSGKSSLLSAWAERTSRRPVFFPVRRDQEDGQQFWLGVLGAICRMCGAEPPAATPEFNGRATVDRVIAALAGAGDAVTLVIDDLHELNFPEALDQLTRLLTHLPANAHVVLATRRDLRLGLHRLRLAGELSEIRAAELRFTEPETRELLDAAEIALSEASIALLYERTEGWAAGLRLAVLSLVGHPDPERFVAKFSGSNRTVAEYLIAEMLDRQSEDVQSMLLRTSLLDQVNGGLADLLTGGSGSERILLELEDANAFVVSLDSERTWFRYHHLFADLLRLQLRRTWPEESPTLHRQAASWFLRHSQAVEAIRHTQAAGDWSDAATTLADHAFSMMLDGKAQTIQALLRAFPQGADHPELTLVRATVDVIQGRLDETAADLAAAEAYARTAPADRLPRLRMAIAALQLSLARRRGQLTNVLEQARLFAAPLSGLSDDDVTPDSDLRAAALMNLGIVEAWSLSSADGERHLLEGARIAREIGRPYLEVSCLAQLGFAAKLHSFASARRRSEEAVALAERHGWDAEPMISPALITLACALIWTGEFDEGARWLRRAERALQTDAGPGIRVLLHLVGGMLHAGRGNHHKALGEFSRAEQLQSRLGPHALAGLVIGWTLATRARVGMPEAALAALAALPDEQAGVGEVRNARAVINLASGDARAALDALGGVLARGVPVVGDFTVVEAHLLAARAQQALGDRRSANYSVERALALAEPDRLILPFAITGSGKLLEALPHHETAHAALLIDILGVLDGASPAAHVTPTPPAGELSPSELRVLRFLPTNLSRSEIAAELLVSVNTVNTHVRNIYAKLQTRDRSAAVQRARELRMLSAGLRPVAPRSPDFGDEGSPRNP